MKKIALLNNVFQVKRTGESEKKTTKKKPHRTLHHCGVKRIERPALG